MITWLISDTHWNHRGIVEAGHRPPDHGEKSLEALRAYVGPQDTLVHLGDVIFSRAGELTGMLGSIRCRQKILVRGNHDLNRSPWYLSHGFDRVVDRLEISSPDEIRETHLTLTHRPVVVSSRTINVHGHLHTMEHRLEELPAGYQLGTTHLLFSLEWTGYRPVALNDFVLHYERYASTKHP